MYSGNKRKMGSYFESAAAGWLTKQGYVITEKNFSCRFGEIDLIAKDEAYLVFIEVKYRKNNSKGAPWEAVNLNKQRRIIATARYYMMVRGYGPHTPVRFDVVGICGGQIRLYKNAFYEGR